MNTPTQEKQKLEIRVQREEIAGLLMGRAYKWIIATNKGEDIDVLLSYGTDEEEDEPVDDLDEDEEEEEPEDDLDEPLF